MSEPTTEAGRILLHEHSSGTPHMAKHIVAIEQEARSDSDRELEMLARQVWGDVYRAMRMENVSEGRATAQADLIRMEVEKFFNAREANKVRELHSERKS